jgi:hypothetical protein
MRFTIEEIMMILRSDYFQTLANTVAPSHPALSTTGTLPSCNSFSPPSATIHSNPAPTVLAMPSLFNPTQPNPTPASTLLPADNSSGSTVPSTKALGKRRAMSDSTEKDITTVEAKPARKKGKRKAPVAREGSSRTLSSFGNIPPPDGPESTTQLPTLAPAPVTAKTPHKRKSKASAQVSDPAVSGIPAMQFIFRTTEKTPSVANGQYTAHPMYPPQNVQQAQQYPFTFIQGINASSGGSISEVQNYSQLSTQYTYPTLQPSGSTLASSSDGQQTAVLAPLEVDKFAAYRIKLVIREVVRTGKLDMLFPYLCYRYVQNLLTAILRLSLDCRVANPTVLTPSAQIKPAAGVSEQTPSIQANNTSVPSFRARDRDTFDDDDNATVCISYITPQFNAGSNQPYEASQSNEFSGETLCDNAAGNSYYSIPIPQSSIDTQNTVQADPANCVRSFVGTGSSMAGPPFQDPSVINAPSTPPQDIANWTVEDFRLMTLDIMNAIASGQVDLSQNPGLVEPFQQFDLMPQVVLTPDAMASGQHLDISGTNIQHAASGDPILVDASPADSNIAGGSGGSPDSDLSYEPRLTDLEGQSFDSSGPTSTFSGEVPSSQKSLPSEEAFVELVGQLYPDLAPYGSRLRFDLLPELEPRPEPEHLGYGHGTV